MLDQFSAADRIEIIKQTLAATFERDILMRKLDGVPGWLMQDEAYALYLLAAHGPGIGDIAEIGSFKGKSTCFLAAGSVQTGRGKVIAIDHFRGSDEHQAGAKDEVREIVTQGSTYDEFKKNVTDKELWDAVEPIQATSERAAVGWTRPLRLLFIDGDHSYEGVKRDFELFSPHVAPEGIVCFHDLFHPDHPGVSRFHDELLQASGWHQLFRVMSLSAITRT